MSIRSSLKKGITGLSQAQEYVCLGTLPSSPLRIWAEVEGQTIEVTDTHIFVGYKPMLIGLLIPPVDAGRKVVLHFRLSAHEPDAATVISKIVFSRSLGGQTIVFCEGIQGSHAFIHPIYQWINGLRERFRLRKSGNVDLPGNLYDQVRIAYSIPRAISVIVVADGNKVNVFPTDLHGPVGTQGYVSSLRIYGKATEQVELYRKLVIADVAAERCREVYGLGANHQGDLQERDQFKWEASGSKLLGLPLPAGTIGYREMALESSLEWGIHRIHFYNVLFHQPAVKEPITHIHQYYAQWRTDRSLPMSILLH
jgi:hypothetical protein